MLLIFTSNYFERDQLQSTINSVFLQNDFFSPKESFDERASLQIFIINSRKMWDHPFSTYAKFFENFAYELNGCLLSGNLSGK